MKITFSNLGKIKRTTLDLRPLTVIIGPNNSNKTYIAYSIYGLWQIIYDSEIGYDEPVKLKITEINPSVFTVKINDQFYEAVNKYFKLFQSKFFDDLDTFFQDSSRRIFTHSKFEIELTKSEINAAINFLLSDEDLAEIFGLIANYENGVIEFREAPDTDVFEDDILDEEYILGRITFYLTFMLFRSPLLLPAERNAFIITYKMLANRRYKHLRQMQREFIGRRSEQRQLDLLKEQGDIRYPQPIEDFLDFLTDVELETLDKKSSEVRQNFYEIAKKIEDNIQGKTQTFFNLTRFGGREIKINVKKGLDIDLYNASSSIKQLAPLLLYLRHRASEGDLLIIDEPEMNLHPEAQAKLLEILGMLVNAGVNVLITTHSPYFMSHLNNLVSGKTDDNAILKEQAKSLYLKDERAFLSLDDVSAYEMKNNKLRSLKDKDYGIRWDTLSDVSADIQQKFFEIYEKSEVPTDGKEE